MIIPMLKGGVGNQLFQIACAYAYAKKHGTDFAINYSLSFCPNQGFSAPKYKDTLFKNISVTTVHPHKIMKENGNAYRELPFLEGDFILDGFFQSEKFFADCVDEIKELFVFPENVKSAVDKFMKVKLSTPSNHPIAGVHIRRGDYKKFSHEYILNGSEYYLAAAKHLPGFVSVVCTDDWSSVSKEMTFAKAEKSPFTDEVHDLYLLSQCDAVVMCNSSFSWWAAFLGKDKKVIAPNNWFVHKSAEDMYCKDWIRI